MQGEWNIAPPTDSAPARLSPFTLKQFEVFGKPEIGFWFEPGEPIDGGRSHGQPQMVGRSEIFPNAMLQFLGDVEHLTAMICLVTLGEHEQLNRGGMMVALTLARLVDHRIGDYMTAAFNAVKPKKDLKRERTFTVNGRQVECEIRYISFWKQNQTGAFSITLRPA